MGIPSTPTAPATPVTGRRTRKTDAWTTLFFALTAALGAWSVTLIGATLLAIIDPSFDADDDTFGLKTIGSLTVALVAVGQAFTMGAAMGKVPKLGLRMGTLMRTHRRVGRVGLALAGVVAFLCWRASGGPPTPEGIVHGALASTGFLAISTKFALLKWRPALAFRVAPWLGIYRRWPSSSSPRAPAWAMTFSSSTTTSSSGMTVTAKTTATTTDVGTFAYPLTTGGVRECFRAVEPIRFAGTIRHWNPEQQRGLAVVDVPPGHIAALGGLGSSAFEGTIGGAEFISSVMPAGGGRLALSVSKAMMSAAGLGIGESADVAITGVGRD